MRRIAVLRGCVVSVGVLLGTLAQAQATVGRTEGDADVTATGAARYRLPLVLPPGTNGLAPSLAITYDSRGGNDLLGVGFRLAGLPAIRRCASTLAQDGAPAPVALGGSDRYCLDGQRLRLAAGTHGASGSQYRTEVETFARVTASGVAGNGPASFVAERRDGLIMEFGTTADARVESAGSDTPREWALSRIRDRNGNFVSFTYAEDASAGAHRPLRIDYTGNQQTGAAPYYSVRFAYETRPAGEVPSGYFAGGVMSAPVRLDRVDVVHLDSGRVVRSYDLAYDVPGATGRSRIASVQECAGPLCLPPTRFTWSAPPAGWGGGLPVTLAAARFAAALPGDFDGDGYDDLAYQDPVSRQWAVLRGGKDGFKSSATNTALGPDSDASQALGADIDGNGMRDVLVPGSGGYWYWLRRNSAGSYSYSTTGVVNPAPPGGLVAADVDGDGRDDLVYVKAGGNAIWWRRNQTTSAASFAAEATLWTAPSGTQLPTSPFLETAQRFRSIVRSGDFNGDGRVDLLVLTQQSSCGGIEPCGSWLSRWTAFASTGGALVPQYAFDGSSESLLADFNADGLTDIGFRVAGGAWQLLLGTGARGTTLAGFAGPYATAASSSPLDGRTLVTDWDADGRMDLLQPDAAGELRYCRSSGTSLEACQPAGIPAGSTTALPMTLDVDGDGHFDVAYAAADVRLHLHQALPPDVVLAVTDGLGARSEFEYAPLSNPVVHRRGRYAVYPVRDLARGGHVVSKALRAGPGGAQRETYVYEGAKTHVQGRGFLGFQRRTVLPAGDAPVRVEQFLQDPAAVERIGLPSLVILQQRDARPLVRTIFSWGRHAYGSGYETRSYGYPSSTTVERFELDGVKVSSTVTASVVDVYGSLLQRTVTTTEHAKGSNPGAQHVETTTLSGVVNDTTNWCLGRPASTQVSRQHSLAGGALVTRSYAHSWDYAKCRRTQDVVEPSSTTLRVVTSQAYDAYGNPGTTQVAPVGQPVRTTSRTWGESGRFLRQTTNPEGHVETVTWDSVYARPTAVNDPNGLAGTLQYDELGRLVRQGRADGSSTALTHAACGVDCPAPEADYVVRAEQRGPGDVPVAAVESGFDRYGREVYWRQDQPGGRQALRVRRYDERGLLTGESLLAMCCSVPVHWVTHAYDVLGRRVTTERPTSQADPTPATTRWYHNGLAVTETDAVGRSTTRRHDALGHVLQVVDPAQADTDYEYDAFGNVVKARDFAGAETLMTYDVRGFRRSINDPSAGRWTFDYLPLGELGAQTNARGQRTTFAYDRLSRPVTRAEPEGTTTWTWGTSAASRNVGTLASVSLPGFRESYEFDAYGRAVATTTTLAGTTLVTRQSFDPATGLPEVLTYPAASGTTPLRVRHHFDRGRLVRLTDADSGATYWQLDAVDGFGRATDETLGNGVRVSSAYDPVTGLLISRTAGPGGGNAYQNLGHAWDALGNLTLREERNRGVQERFTYDSLDRLDQVTRGGVLVLDLAYDALGNLTYKSDVGTYRYDAVRRQAVVAAGSNTYGYDANGAVVNASGTAISWLSYDLPGQLTHPGGNYSAFQYGPDRARYRQVARSGGVLTETLYAAGGLYERVTSDGATSERLYVVADGRRVAVQVRAAGTLPSTVYLLADHLGGVAGLTSSSGALLAQASYQPWGARRSGDWQGVTPTAAEWQQIQRTTPRGYTAQEHLDNLGVVHMNGRVYDPVLGRFLSPDPLAQAPYDTQGMNRYAYARNNPLRYTDATGLCISGGEATSQAAHCLEEIVVESSSLSLMQYAGMAGIADLASWFGTSSGGAATGGAVRPPALAGAVVPPPPAVTGPAEEVITVSASRLSQDAGMVMVPALPAVGLPWHVVASSRSLLMMGVAGALTAILAAPATVAETSDLLDGQGEPWFVYHFTNNPGMRGISASGLVLPGASGLVYFSPVPYPSAEQAQAALSLPRSPTGYFVIPRSNIPAPLPWSPVGPNFGQPGGGLEASYRGAVPLTGSRWVPFAPRMQRNGGE